MRQREMLSLTDGDRLCLHAIGRQTWLARER
jgi:hypothetical protein